METTIHPLRARLAWGRAGLIASAVGLGLGCAAPSATDAAAKSAIGAHPSAAGTPADSLPAPSYASDVAFAARERPPESEHWRAVQERCASVFEHAGLKVSRQAYGTGVNVIGELPGTSHPDEIVMLSAHYDSIPGCAGADDNATGVAGVWRAARALSGQRRARSFVLACWDEEERGLVGSRAFVSSLAGRRVVAHLVFEMIGYTTSEANSQRLPPGFDQLFPGAVQQISARNSRGDFIAMILDEASAEVGAAYARHAAGTGLPVVQLTVPRSLQKSDVIGHLRRSDHAPFWSADLPSILLTDTAEFRNPGYHCQNRVDEAASLDYDFAADVVDTSVAVLQGMLEPASSQLAPSPGSE